MRPLNSEISLGPELSPATVTRLEKAAVDNGFDRELPRCGVWLVFASSQTTLRLWLSAPNEHLCVAAFSQAHVAAGLDEFGDAVTVMCPEGAVSARAVTGIPELHTLVRRAYQLSRTLPDALLNAFKQATAGLPNTTEVERLVIVRVGQELFRGGLLEYWQGRCAVTGLATPELLRASHIKPWAACDTDGERLDIFNGLLLAPNLDAAFDRGLITVAGDGVVLVSPALADSDRRALGLHEPLRVAGLATGHHAYLDFHRTQIFRTVTVTSGAAGAPRAKHMSAEHLST